MNSLIEHLHNKRLIWRANQQSNFVKGNSTGFKELDQALQGGFPEHGVVDIDTPIGIGEIRLLLPALRARQQQHERLLVFISAPMQINGEMLAEYGFPLEQVLIIQPQNVEHALWSAEQCLRSGCAHSVLLWHQELEISQAKRLQLAAEQGDALHFIFRHQHQLSLSLPVNLAMKLRPHRQGINIQVTKRKGGWPDGAFNIDMSPAWPQLTFNQDNNNIIPFPQSKVS